jgi:hypothetical protein
VSSQPAGNNDWQRIWFAIQQHPWSSLALVPSDSRINVRKVAEGLVATGRLQGERPVGLIDATGVQLGDIQQVLTALASASERSEHTVVPVDAIIDNPSAIAIVQATTVALLVVRLGESHLASAQTTLDAIGRNRFVGSIVVDSAGNATVS